MVLFYCSSKLPDYNSRKIEAQYFNHHATFTSSIVLSQKASIIGLSATVGIPMFALCAETGYETYFAKLTKYTAGVTVKKHDPCASITLGDKGDTIMASYVCNPDSLKRSVAVGENSRRLSSNENKFTVGGSYAVDTLTAVKAKLTIMES